VIRTADVFIVDDDAQLRTMIANVLVGNGFAPHQFENATEVDEALAASPPALIILDLSLGDSDAVEVIHSLARVRFTGDVLLMSGHDTGTLEEVRSIGSAHGLKMLAPLHKPFRAHELRAAVDTAKPAVAAPRSTTDLEAALENSWLQLWYQPKIDLQKQSLCGAEGLVRIAHPEKGILSPAGFLPPPGDPLYVPLTDYVVRRALSDWSVLAAKGVKHRLAINVPASVLQRPDFVTNLRKYLPKDPDFPGLIVEITEDEAIADPELAREIAVRLKLYNVGVSIDDFGAGYSTLTRLKEIPFSEIKLDRSFVRGCAEEEQKQDMCRAVVELAQRFGVKSVAEGVETRDELKFISDLGYDIGQGYLFAHPMPLDDLLRLAASRTPAGVPK